MKKIIFTALSIVILFPCAANAGKQQKKNKVKSITIMETVNENGKPITYKASVETFDKSGNTTSLTEYAKDGTIVKKETTVYDNNQNVVEETFFNSKTNKNYKKSYRYSVVKDKTPLAEEIEYNAAGKVIKKTVYTYNSAGKKANETVTDGNGELVSKSMFQYNSKNLKTQKHTYNKTNGLEAVKEWQYDYY
jgi:hypothetical protein